MAFHGKPRHTGDLDIWINISEKNAVRLLKVIKEFGMASLGLKKSDFLKPGYVTQIGNPPLRIDILNEIDGISFDEAAQNKERFTLDEGIEIAYTGLRDFIANKLASGRSRDLADIKELEKKQTRKKKTNK